MCASRGFEYACSERWTLVRIPNRDVLPTCGKPMMPVFIVSSQFPVLCSQLNQKNKSLDPIRIREWNALRHATLGKMQLKRTTHHRQFFCQVAGTLIVCIACAVGASAQRSAQRPARSPTQIHFRLQTREVVEGRLKSFSTNNSARETLIRKWFAE